MRPLPPGQHGQRAESPSVSRTAVSRTTGDHASTPGSGNSQPADGVGDVLELDYGFQLECRFCKKFEVNAAHNPRRTAAQMKEDGARRRGFELLLTALYGESDSLLYRKRTGGRELVDDVYKRFGGRCFKCGVKLEPKEMRLDHTRPLALLWAWMAPRLPSARSTTARNAIARRPSTTTPRS